MINNKNNMSINLYYMYSFLSAFILTRGVFLLYLASSGLNMFQISLYQSIYFISSAIFEVPTGYIGDKTGKKKSIIIGLWILAFHSFFMYINNNFYIFLLLGALEGLAYSFVSGSDSALLYEILEKNNNENNYLKINNNILSIRSIVTGISLVLGSILIKYSWGFLYILTGSIFILSTLPLIFVDEAKSEVNINHKKTLIIEDVFNSILYKPVLVFISFVLFSSMYDGLFMCYYNFNQIILPEYGLQIKYIGVFFASLYFINSIAYIFVNSLVKFLNSKQVFIIFIYVESLLFLIKVFVSNLPFVIISSILICFCSEIIFSISDSIIQKYISSNYRATFLSIVSLIRSFTSSLMFLLLGYLFEIKSFEFVYLVISVFLFTTISLCLTVFVFVFKKHITD